MRRLARATCAYESIVYGRPQSAAWACLGWLFGALFFGPPGTRCHTSLFTKTQQSPIPSAPHCIFLSRRQRSREKCAVVASKQGVQIPTSVAPGPRRDPSTRVARTSASPFEGALDAQPASHCSSHPPLPRSSSCARAAAAAPQPRAARRQKRPTHHYTAPARAPARATMGESTKAMQEETKRAAAAALNDLEGQSDEDALRASAGRAGTRRDETRRPRRRRNTRPRNLHAAPAAAPRPVRGISAAAPRREPVAADSRGVGLRASPSS